MADFTITPADVLWLGGMPIQKGTAAEAIAAGEAVALDANGKIVKADADLIGTVSQLAMLGIALSSPAAANQPVHYATTGSNVRLAIAGNLGSTATPVFLSTAAGKLMPHTDLIDSSDGYPCLVGYLYDSVARRNIKLTISRADEIFAD